MKISIYVATQKQIDIKLHNIYEPIFVGSDFCKTKINNILTDNTGDNISNKNKTYCELTALYWLWKNSNSNIVGLMHYRRFLCKRGFFGIKNRIIDSNDIVEILKKYDIILPCKTCLYGPIKKQYSLGQKIEDYEKLREVIKEFYPKYLKTFDEFSNQDQMYICNIFICNKNLIDKYCEWLFDIMEKLENSIDLTNYTVSQKRVFGYLAERLFNVWIICNNLNIKELPLLKIDEKILDKIRKYFHLFCYKCLKIDVLYFSAKRNKIKYEK